jgi:DNA-binding transcriptional ArsR family regulator
VPNEAGAFAALADPTRRRVLQLLRDGEQSVAWLTARLPVSQSAVSQHLRVLKEAELVSDRAAGTRRLYRVEPDGLSVVRAFVDQFWEDVLDAFTTFAEGTGDDHLPVGGAVQSHPTGASPTGASPTGASPTGASPTGASPTGASRPTLGVDS